MAQTGASAPYVGMLVMPFLGALVTGAAWTLATTDADSRDPTEWAAAIVFIVGPLLGVIIWFPDTRPGVPYLGALCLGLAAGLTWANAYTYWQGVASMQPEILGMLGTPFLAPITFAMLALAPPFGGRRAIYVAALMGLAFLAMVVWTVATIVRLHGIAPPGFQVGRAVSVTGIIVGISVPALAYIGRSFLRLRRRRGGAPVAQVVDAPPAQGLK